MSRLASWSNALLCLFSRGTACQRSACADRARRKTCRRLCLPETRTKRTPAAASRRRGLTPPPHSFASTPAPLNTAFSHHPSLPEASNAKRRPDVAGLCDVVHEQRQRRQNVPEDEATRRGVTPRQ